jgi:hypothetical protein
VRDTCATCAAPYSDEERVCHYCGTARGALSNVAAERATLEELHQAMAAAMFAASRGEESPDAVRDRFLQNGFIPSHAELLVEEAVRCQQFFREDVAADTAAPRARYRACLLRLELLAVDDSRWKPKVAILQKNLDAERARVRRSNAAMIAVFGVLLVLAVWLGVYVFKAVMRLGPT